MQDTDKLLKANKGLVYAQLRKFYLLDDPEAESIAFSALWKAIETFDDTKEIRLSTYATVCIYNALGSYVRYLKSSRRLQTVSYDGLLKNNDGDETDFRNLILADTHPDPMQKVAHAEMLSTLVSLFNEQMVDTKNEKQRSIMLAWQESGYTAQAIDIAKQVGVSQSYVSQILCGCKNKLKKKMEELYHD